MLVAERDYLKEEMGMFIEQTEILEKEKTALSQELKEKRELDEFKSLEEECRTEEKVKFSIRSGLTFFPPFICFKISMHIFHFVYDYMYSHCTKLQNQLLNEISSLKKAKDSCEILCQELQVNSLLWFITSFC